MVQAKIEEDGKSKELAESLNDSRKEIQGFYNYKLIWKMFDLQFNKVNLRKL